MRHNIYLCTAKTLTPVIASNMGTVLCFHKKLKSSISLGSLCVSSNTYYLAERD